MTRTDSLRLLLAAEPANNLSSIEATMRAITERIDVLEPGSAAYVAAHRRLDELIDQRGRLTQEAQRVRSDPGGG